jgi:hypothetical protein
MLNTDRYRWNLPIMNYFSHSSTGHKNQWQPHHSQTVIQSHVVHPYHTPQKIQGVIVGSNKATGWTVQDSNLNRSKRYSNLQNVQTGSTVHPASCLMGTVGLSWG